VGHHRGDELNPLTNKVEPNGTTIVDVSNPREPKIVKHIPGYKGSESRAVQVVEKYFDGKDYILRNQESSEFIGFEVWEVTDKETTARTKPRLKKVIQTNDVDLDYRGLIYITDRAGTGLHILEYTGEK
jgi:hypothetical protein